MDSTKLKSRTFQQSAKVAEKKDASGPNLWTETPAERQQRLEDEMLGKKRKAEGLTGGADEDESDEARRKRQRDWQLREEVDRHNVRASRFIRMEERELTSISLPRRKQRARRRYSIRTRKARKAKQRTTRRDRQESGTVIVTCRLVGV